MNFNLHVKQPSRFLPHAQLCKPAIRREADDTAQAEVAAQARAQRVTWLALEDLKLHPLRRLRQAPIHRNPEGAVLSLADGHLRTAR